MTAICGVWGFVCEIDNSSKTVRCAGKCVVFFHIACLSSKSRDAIKTRKGKQDWQCETCKEPSSMGSGKSETTVITKEFLIKTLESFKNEVFGELKSYTNEFAKFRRSLDIFSAKIDSSNTLMEDMKHEFKKMKEENSELKKENNSLKNSVGELETRVRNLEQYSRQSNIEISGVPETGGENMDQLLSDIARAMNMEVKKETVVAAHRLPSYNKKRTPSIVVKFTTRREKEVWLNAFKNVRPLTANMIHPSFARDKTVYVNEHLSPANKQLLAKTKEIAKAKNYKFIWCKDGKILVKRDTEDKIIKIESEVALKEL